MLSHADLDHYNGLPDLLERFAVGQVSHTPTFPDRKLRAVEVALKAIERRGVPTRVVKAGDRLTAGDVQMEVLHPPVIGPEGNENARSLVLLVRQAGHTILLTGDLEGPGLARLLSLPPQQVDVLMAPHHGSPTTSPPALAQWARPSLVVSSEGRPRSGGQVRKVYEAVGARYLTTWERGAVTVRSVGGRLLVETFLDPADKQP
jgi:competence protein ComEC